VLEVMVRGEQKVCLVVLMKGLSMSFRNDALKCQSCSGFYGPWPLQQMLPNADVLFMLPIVASRSQVKTSTQDLRTKCSGCPE